MNALPGEKEGEEKLRGLECDRTWSGRRPELAAVEGQPALWYHAYQRKLQGRHLDVGQQAGAQREPDRLPAARVVVQEPAARSFM
ncbi:hypothetical protein ALI22I_15000 [Saccharothrix sp. ALI-22-I]|uniref:hypothetical protein n=1 Tax=Saccharothrix sp. ALI-22-I TaxID=1933778 RepID=UPI00097C2308|nr:hypothetical protein [Saccharothrix sp. ALI-22-I]ONI89784.1 hypothetical protein ALI22I_15000 [Saccharothrix sp. ALI-22-I]